MAHFASVLENLLADFLHDQLDYDKALLQFVKLVNFAMHFFAWRY